MKSFQHSECNCKEHMLSCIYIYTHCIALDYISISPYIIDGNFQAYGCYDFTYGSLDWSQEVDGTLKACSLVTPIRNSYCCGGAATTSTIVISKKSPTGPTQRTPKPEYLIGVATSLGVRWEGPLQFLMDYCWLLL